MDIISFNEASTANGRIESFIENPDSTSGIVTVPKTIASGETITIPAGRVAVLPNLVVGGTLNIEIGGEVFIPSGATFDDLDTQIALKADTFSINTAGIALKTIASGTATFNSTTNNINFTGIGVGVEVGDVIQISGADDAKNNSEFTIEVITDADNIIVNQAHTNKGTSKNVANRASDTGVTVKLLAKWYNAPLGLGQDWVDVKNSRIYNTNYPNNTNRTIELKVSFATPNIGASQGGKLFINDLDSGYIFANSVQNGTTNIAGTGTASVTKSVNYKIQQTGTATIQGWEEFR